MDVAAWCRQARILIVAGKGGVGKTTVSASLAVMAARAGLEVLVVQLEGEGSVASVLGHPRPIGYEEVVLRSEEGGGRIRARAITPDEALLEYLADHGLRAVSKRLVSSGTVDVISTAVPGIRDILVLGKVKQLERTGGADLILLDAPATGHALTFLSSPAGLVDVAKVGPIRVQASEVGDLLRDPARCRVLLVTLPEETPVNEVIETAHRLEGSVGMTLAHVVINGRYHRLEGLDRSPDQEAAAVGAHLDPGHARVLREAALFRLERQRLQADQINRLARSLAVPMIEAPYLFAAEIGCGEIDHLAAALAGAVAALPDQDDQAQLEPKVTLAEP
jgi:hypothetical protein